MKKTVIKNVIFVALIVLLVTSNICGGETTALVQDILTDSDNCWKDLHLLPRQLIGSMILHNHPIVPFILRRANSVVTELTGFFKGYLRSAKFSSSGDRVLVTTWFDTDTYTLNLWDANSGKCLHTLVDNYLWSANEQICSAEFNGAGDLILTCFQDGTAKLWSTNRGRCLRTLTGHTDRINSAEFSGEGDLILTCSQDGTVKLWDTNSGDCLHTFTGPTDSVSLSVFGRSGDRVLIGFSGGTAQLWDTSSGERLQTLIGHTLSIESAKFSSSGARILTVSSDGTARLWNTKSGECLQTFQDPLTKFNASEDMILTYFGRNAKLWDSNSGECLYTLEGHTDKICSAQFNDSGDLVITSSRDKTVKLWETKSGQCLHALTGHIDGINSAKFNCAGDLILTCSQNGTTMLWNTDSGECLHTLGSRSDRIYSAEFNVSGDLVVTYSTNRNAKSWDTRNRKAKLWDTNSGQHLQTLLIDDLHDDLSPIEFNSSGDRVLMDYFREARLHDISQSLKLRNFFFRDDGVTLNQALVLIGIYEIIIFRKLQKKRESSSMSYYRRLTDMLKVFSTSKNEQSSGSNCIVFDFCICPHLQPDYEKLPQEIQKILDKYVRKVPWWFRVWSKTSVFNED